MLLQPMNTGVPDASAGAGAASCTHCHLPVPKGMRVAAAQNQFCCTGCETAYAIIHSCGLEKYYALRDAAEDGAAPVRLSGRAYAEFDDPVFRSLYHKNLGDGLMSAEWFLEGVHCSACMWLVEKLPRLVKGVVDARLDLAHNRVRVTWDDRVVRASRIAAVLDSIGYPPHAAKGQSATEAQRRAARKQLMRLAVAGACAGNVMLLATALYAGVFDTMEPQYAALFRWVSLGLSLVCLAWPGSVFFASAWAAVRTRTMHLDVPITLALLAGAVSGIINTVLSRGEIYFDTISALVFLLLVGRVIQGRQQRQAASAVELLFSLTPTSARHVETIDGREQITERPIEALSAGDLVEIRAGDSAPVDGVIVRGSSRIDQSLLTGESIPVAVRTGDAISAGSTNLASPLVVRTVATGTETRVGKLMQLVQDASRRRAPIVRFVDRVGGVFTVAMLALAAATFIGWLFVRPEVALDHALALLIVTCPCALGLAAPLVMTVAIGRSAARGALVKGADALQLLSDATKPGVTPKLFLDKTGTLTMGKLSIVRTVGDASALSLAGALEAGSSHPVARAIVAAAQVPGLIAGNIAEVTGGGIIGTVDEHQVIVGSPRFVGERAHVPGWCEDAVRTFTREALSPVLVAVDGAVTLALGLGDDLRRDAPAAVAQLKALGFEVSILSGDHPDAVAAVARRLGIDADHAHGGMCPEAKLARVEQAVRTGPVVMVGDGVNDAAALAAATVGIAAHGGAEASLAAADIYLTRPDLTLVAQLVDASQRTMATIRRTLVASTCYNVLAGSLAVVGLIHPLIAAILMPLSSLTVLTLSLRWRTFSGERTWR